jgi:superfamily II DNA/RNA helicase
MPQSPDRHAVSPRRGTSEPRRGAAEPRRGTSEPRRGTSGPRRRTAAPRRRGGDAARNGPAVRRDNRLAVRRDDQAAELDRALTAALQVPPPEPTTFRELGLAARLVDALAARGIDMPFAIQARALPDALAGRDVLGRAQTGSGKTLAFGLPMLTRLAGSAGRLHDKAPRGLVLVPTRELARQVAEVLTPLGRTLGVSVTTVYGGAPIGRQIDQIRRGVDIVVATPGRLIDLLDRGALTLADIDITVLDEADHMADLGFLPAVTRILDATPAGRQRMLFSATLDRGVAQLVHAYLGDPAVHAVAPEVLDGGAAEHRVLVLSAQDKVPVAAEIAGRPARTLFFVRTKHGADRLAKQFRRTGVDAVAIHGNLNQNQRQRALAAFAAGHPRVLVATDVAARGIHVDDVELVVHFDPPNDHKDYLHRSGRTARAGASGMVVALVDHAQARDVGRMHDAAGVTATRDDVQTGHHVVRQIATSGTPVPPASDLPPVRAPQAQRASAQRPPGQPRAARSAEGGHYRRSGQPRQDGQRRQRGQGGQPGPGKASTGTAGSVSRSRRQRPGPRRAAGTAQG